MEEKHMAEQKPPPAGEPGQTPPLQPGEGRGGFMGLGEPYVDFIPTFPMVKDPATGEWRNAQPGELDGVANDYGDGPDLDGNGIPDEVGINPDNQQPGYPGTATQQTDADIPPSPGPTLDPSLLDPNAPYEPETLQQTLDNRLDPNAPYEPVNLPETGEVDQSFKVTGPPNQIPPGLEDEVAALEKTLGPDEVISIDLTVDQTQDNRLDPNAPYEPAVNSEILDNRLDPNAPYKPVNLPETGEVDQSFKVGTGTNPIPPGYEDEVAAIEAAGGVPTFTEPVKQPEDQPGGRLDPNAPADPGLPKFARDDLGQPPPGDSSEPPPPAPDPETVQALDPNLLDPIAPGPTLDTGLVERIEQSPGLVEAVNQDPAVAEALEQDPTQLDQIEQNLGLAEQRPVEPSAVTDLGGVTDPSLVPDVPDPGPPDQDFDDIPN
jgi:hypothetical protein